MTNHEITYERSINKSFMKVAAIKETCLDEKLMFRKNFKGILPMEKCYVNGAGEYWYNISGKQALDTYANSNMISQSFFEMLILRICSQLEILEWNLIDASCLVIDPDYIFVGHNGEDVEFVLYPNRQTDFFDDLHNLMEYLLTKLNHADQEGIKQPYKIYEMTLNKGYTLQELKESIIRSREKEEEVRVEKTIPTQELPVIKQEEDISKNIESKIEELLARVKSWFSFKREGKEELPLVVYPEDEREEKLEVTNPTICLAATLSEPQGRLIYEGMGDYPDFELEQGICMLGKNPRVRLYLDRETVSQFHAKFDYFEHDYYIEDMNSTNGTFVNDEILNYKEKKVLSPGDVIRFADIKYRFL